MEEAGDRRNVRAVFRIDDQERPGRRRASIATLSGDRPTQVALSKLFRADTKDEARTIRDEIFRTFEKKAPKAMDCLEEGFDEALTILAFPRKYRVRFKSTNAQERLNEEIRRRERVIRIFPNEDSAIRLIGALLAEFHEQWSTGKKYLDMTEYHEQKKQQESLKVSSVLSVLEQRFMNAPFREKRFTALLGLDHPDDKSIFVSSD
jgi:hypothetical protein